MANSIAQFEAELIGWINFFAILVSFPFFGFYTYQTLEGVDDLEFFLSIDPRGQELFSVLVRFAVFLSLWTPMCVLLKIATLMQSSVLLKSWTVAQVLLIFIVALHLLVWPPRSLILVLGYAVAFAYFLTSLWMAECLLRELKGEDEGSKVRRLHDIEDIAALASVDLDGNNNASIVSSFLCDSAEFRRTIDDNEELSMQMKKIKQDRRQASHSAPTTTEMLF